MNWQEDTEGYTVLEDRGQFVYATLNPKGKLIPTSWIVGRDNPAAIGLTAHTMPTADEPAAAPLAPGAIPGPSAPVKLPGFTGISSPYEAPEQPALLLDTGRLSIEECLSAIQQITDTCREDL